jgi:hypothetical protein
MKILVQSGKQLLKMWRASMSAAQRAGKISPKQVSGLEGKFNDLGGLQVNSRPQDAYRAIIESHNFNGVQRLLPKDIKIQEVGMGALQASKVRKGAEGMTRLANKAESTNQRMRRLGFKIKKDPKVREY